MQINRAKLKSSDIIYSTAILEQNIQSIRKMCVFASVCVEERWGDFATHWAQKSFRLGSLPEVNTESWYLISVIFSSVVLQMYDPYFSSHSVVTLN